jgi:hypothetical protein
MAIKELSGTTRAKATGRFGANGRRISDGSKCEYLLASSCSTYPDAVTEYDIQIHPQSVSDNTRPTPQVKQIQAVDDSGSKKKFCCCVIM